jgi:hypothetical protein
MATEAPKLNIPRIRRFSYVPLFGRLRTRLVLREKMIVKRHNPTVPVALECTFLLLAISVFGWGLQAKLSVYRTKPGKFASPIYMAKLATEKSTALTVAIVDNKEQCRPALGRQHLTHFAFWLIGNHFPTTVVSQPEPGPRIPGRYNLYGSNLMRRPPPVLL